MQPYSAAGLRVAAGASPEEAGLFPAAYYKYRLAGILIHSGTAEAGHYYSYVKRRNYDKRSGPKENSSDSFFSFDDTRVENYNMAANLENDCFGGTFYQSVWDHQSRRTVQKEYNRSNSAYMLLYEREWEGDEEDGDVAASQTTGHEDQKEQGGAMDVDTVSASAEENEEWESVCKWDQSQVVRWVANSGLACASKAAEAFQNVSSLNGSVLLKLPLDKLQSALEQRGCTTEQSAQIWQKIEGLRESLKYNSSSSSKGPSALIAQVLAQNFQFTHDQLVLQPGYFDFVGQLVAANTTLVKPPDGSKNARVLPPNVTQESAHKSVELALDFLTHVFLKSSVYLRSAQQVERWRNLLTNHLVQLEACSLHIIRLFSRGLSQVVLMSSDNRADGTTLVCETVCAAINEAPVASVGLDVMVPMVETILMDLQQPLKAANGQTRNIGAMCQVGYLHRKFPVHLNQIWGGEKNTSVLIVCLAQVLYRICDKFKPDHDAQRGVTPVWSMLYSKETLHICMKLFLKIALRPPVKASPKRRRISYAEKHGLNDPPVCELKFLHMVILALLRGVSLPSPSQRDGADDNAVPRGGQYEQLVAVEQVAGLQELMESYAADVASRIPWFQTKDATEILKLLLWENPGTTQRAVKILLHRALHLQQPHLREYLLVLTELGKMGDSCMDARRRLIYYGSAELGADACSVASTQRGLFAVLRECDPLLESAQRLANDHDYLQLYVATKAMFAQVCGVCNSPTASSRIRPLLTRPAHAIRRASSWNSIRPQFKSGESMGFRMRMTIARYSKSSILIQTRPHLRGSRPERCRFGCGSIVGCGAGALLEWQRTSNADTANRTTPWPLARTT